MNSIKVHECALQSTDSEVEFAKAVESEALKQEQVEIETTHNFHAGIYSRTILIPKGVLITGALITIDTLLTIAGHCIVFNGPNGATEYKGYNIIKGMAGRKNVFYALQDTYLTMQFATKSIDVDSAEREFTSEIDKLASRGK